MIPTWSLWTVWNSQGLNESTNLSPRPPTNMAHKAAKWRGLLEPSGCISMFTVGPGTWTWHTSTWSGRWLIHLPHHCRGPQDAVSWMTGTRRTKLPAIVSTGIVFQWSTNMWVKQVSTRYRFRMDKGDLLVTSLSFNRTVQPSLAECRLEWLCEGKFQTWAKCSSVRVSC
jgi:hypothetical protein